MFNQEEGDKKERAETIRRIKELEARVEICLKEYPETRNSDLKLTVQLWRNHFPNYIHKDEWGDEVIEIDDFIEVLPREDLVSRCRRKVNARGLYLTTLLTVAKARHLNEEAWREAMKDCDVPNEGNQARLPLF